MQPGSLAFKRAFCIGFLSLAILNFAPLSRAVTVEAVPNPRQKNGSWVTDMANILSPTTEAEINRLISELEAKNGSEIAVVTVPETAPSASPKEFATTLFNRWGIGKKGQDNGVLFLISKGDRRVEIETGYGVEALLPDAKVGNIIQQEITPRFKQKNFDGGTLAGTKALLVALRAYKLPATPINPKSNLNAYEGGINWIPGIGVVVVLVSAAAAVKIARRPILLEPEGRSRIEGAGSNWRPFRCTQCKQRMEKLDATALQPYLSPPELVAQQLGSVRYEGWQCLNCRPLLTGAGIHIRAYVLDSKQFSVCPTCQELTVSSTFKVLEAATWNQEGKGLVIKNCHSCPYHQETEEVIPCLSPPPDTVFLEPEGRSRLTDSRFFNTPESQRPTHCADCHYPMEQIDLTALSSHLRQPEQVAQQLGSVKFIGWRCPNTHPPLTGLGMHIRAYILDTSRFRECPTCQELTMEHSAQILRSATQYSEGIRQITHRCHCCSYKWVTQETTPRLPPSPRSSTSMSDGSSSSSSWISDSSYSSSTSTDSDSSSSSDSSYSTSTDSSSSWSSDSSSSSSSDFGGGSSGGGGAGGDW